jgi:hypothetical protein
VIPRERYGLRRSEVSSERRSRSTTRKAIFASNDRRDRIALREPESRPEAARPFLDLDHGRHHTDWDIDQLAETLRWMLEEGETHG